jgi:hypothetical protein
MRHLEHCELLDRPPFQRHKVFYAIVDAHFHWRVVDKHGAKYIQWNVLPRGKVPVCEALMQLETRKPASISVFVTGSYAYAILRLAQVKPGYAATPDARYDFERKILRKVSTLKVAALLGLGAAVLFAGSRMLPTHKLEQRLKKPPNEEAIKLLRQEIEATQSNLRQKEAELQASTEKSLVLQGKKRKGAELDELIRSNTAKLRKFVSAPTESYTSIEPKFESLKAEFLYYKEHTKEDVAELLKKIEDMLTQIEKCKTWTAECESHTFSEALFEKVRDKMSGQVVVNELPRLTIFPRQNNAIVAFGYGYGGFTQMYEDEKNTLREAGCTDFQESVFYEHIGNIVMLKNDLGFEFDKSEDQLLPKSTKPLIHQIDEHLQKTNASKPFPVSYIQRSNVYVVLRYTCNETDYFCTFVRVADLITPQEIFNKTCENADNLDWRDALQVSKDAFKLKDKFANEKFNFQWFREMLSESVYIGKSLSCIKAHLCSNYPSDENLLTKTILEELEKKTAPKNWKFAFASTIDPQLADLADTMSKCQIKKKM